MVIQHTTTLDKIAKLAGKWLTTRQIAQKLGVHPETIRRWADTGRIKHIRHPINNYRLFLESDLGDGKNDEA